MITFAKDNNQEFRVTLKGTKPLPKNLIKKGVYAHYLYCSKPTMKLGLTAVRKLFNDTAQIHLLSLRHWHSSLLGLPINSNWHSI